MITFLNKKNKHTHAYVCTYMCVHLYLSIYLSIFLSVYLHLYLIGEKDEIIQTRLLKWIN